jgi:hypothetical protein
VLIILVKNGFSHPRKKRGHRARDIGILNVFLPLSDEEPAERHDGDVEVGNKERVCEEQSVMEGLYI